MRGAARVDARRNVAHRSWRVSSARDGRGARGTQAAGRRVDWVVATDLPRLHGDIALLGRLLQLLLDNALKFSRARDPAVIRIGWQPVRAGWCALQIQDNGAGFDPRFADRLFKAFQRLHSARQFEGLGMGLALARAVVERHGGRIHAEGRPDAGCTVSLELPLAAGAGA